MEGLGLKPMWPHNRWTNELPWLSFLSLFFEVGISEPAVSASEWNGDTFVAVPYLTKHFTNVPIIILSISEYAASKGPSEHKKALNEIW